MKRKQANSEEKDFDDLREKIRQLSTENFKLKTELSQLDKKNLIFQGKIRIKEI